MALYGHTLSVTTDDSVFQLGEAWFTLGVVTPERLVSMREEWQRADKNGERFFPHEFLFKVLRSGVLKKNYQIDPKDSWMIAAAEKISFTPNELARGLINGRTGTVGLLTSDLEGRFVIPILMGAEDAFGAGQVNVFLCDARGDAIREQHHLKALLTRRVDGIIVVGRQTDPRPSLGHDLSVPADYAYAHAVRRIALHDRDIIAVV